MLKSKKYNLPKFGANKKTSSTKSASSKEIPEQSLTEKYKERKKQLTKPGGIKQPYDSHR
jgi:hypothetical protein